MVDLCKEAGNPKPKFIELTGSFTVVFSFKEPIGRYTEDKKLELTLREQEILKLLEKSKLNSAQVARKMKIPLSVRTVQINLSQLEKMGIIKREGKARAMVWTLNKK